MSFGEEEGYVKYNWERVFMFGASVMEKTSRQTLQLFLAVARHAEWVRGVQVRQSQRTLHICLLFENQDEETTGPFVFMFQ